MLWDSISVPHAGRAAHLISNEDKSVLGGHTCTRMGGLQGLNPQGSTFPGAWGHMPLDFAVGP